MCQGSIRIPVEEFGPMTIRYTLGRLRGDNCALRAEHKHLDIEYLIRHESGKWIVISQSNGMEFNPEESFITRIMESDRYQKTIEIPLQK